MDDPVTLIEKYERAITNGQIVVDSNHRTSADFLLASAMAQAGSAKNRAAIALYRLHTKVSSEGAHEVRAWAVPELMRKYQRGHSPLRTRSAGHVFELVLHWYLEGVCPACQGRRYELVPGTQIISGQVCRLCLGEGREPVHHRLPARQQDAGRWLADEFGNLLSVVQAEMGRLLRDATT